MKVFLVQSKVFTAVRLVTVYAKTPTAQTPLATAVAAGESMAKPGESPDAGRGRCSQETRQSAKP